MALAAPKGLAALLAKSAGDVVILSSLRTPVCRAHKGRLKDAYPEELLAAVLEATRRRLPPAAAAAVDDVAVGVVLSELGGSKAARMALAHAGFDVARTGLHTVNRACASSLQAVADVAARIRVGDADVAVAAGMESMTRNYASRALPLHLWPALRRSSVKAARDCVLPMGLTSETLARRYGVSRPDQDAFALASHRRAAAARDAGRFDDEMVPVTTRLGDDDDDSSSASDNDEGRIVTVACDDGIRDAVSLDALARLKPVFAPDGASTAGNSSQVSDGAAATLLARRSAAAALGLEGRILGRFVSAVVAGCAPDEMGVGPAVAVPRLLARHGLAPADVHRWEINEAFASQALYCLRALGLESAWERGRVNPDGGAIALGHPLGATGARMTSTLVHGLRRADGGGGGGELGVVTMCVGTGMGMAALFVRE